MSARKAGALSVGAPTYSGALLVICWSTVPRTLTNPISRDLTILLVWRVLIPDRNGNNRHPAVHRLVRMLILAPDSELSAAAIAEAIAAQSAALNDKARSCKLGMTDWSTEEPDDP